VVKLNAVSHGQYGELNIWQVYDRQGLSDRLSWPPGLFACLHPEVTFKVNHFYWPTNALNCIKLKC